MPRRPTDPPLRVVHFGNDPDSVRGGIAAVIRQHLGTSGDGVEVTAVATYAPTAQGHRRRNAPYLTALRRALRLPATAPVIAHVHVSQGGSLLREGLLVLLLRLRRVPTVVTLHGSSSLTSTGLPRLATGAVLRCATVAHFLSDAHRRRYERVAGRSVTIPNVVAVEGAGTTDKQPTVVFAGVVGTRKGVDLLLEAWRSVPSDGWCLHLYGPPDADFPLPEGVPDVVAHGEVAPTEVQDALARSAVAVLPSREEAFPMFLLEAMAHRCAIVAADVGGVRELLGDAGVVVPREDAGALAEALTMLVSQADARSELSEKAGRRTAERFDAGVIACRWAETYGSLAGRPSGEGIVVGG
jgi:glycosyltransferase involved in cell wall biosynthesis